jgi:hypothetical protein
MAIRRQKQTILASAARTTTVVSQVFSAEHVIASTFVIDVTAVTATPTITATIEGKDPLSGAFYAILVDTGITATGTTFLQVGHTIIAAANVAANNFLPDEYRVTVTHTDADSITYSISAIHMVDI